MLNTKEYDEIARSGCFVCRIVEKKPLIPNPQVIYEDDQVIAFLSQLPTQKGYSLVCPKRHVERYEKDLTEDEWLHLLKMVKKVSQAISDVTNAMRMYTAMLGSPERNSHIHIHVCPCPQGTPFEKQQFAAMQFENGEYVEITDEDMKLIANQIKEKLNFTQ